MYILIEGYSYEAAKVKDVLHGIDALENVEGMVSVNYVGYFYNTKVGDCVYILPKVLLNDRDMVFGDYAPKDIINLNDNNPLKYEEKRFIYEFAVWVYRAIVVFKKNNPKSDIVYQKKVAQAGRGRRHKTDTFLDIILALIQFNKDNQNFFFFVLRNLHSGYNKINWTRTISTTNAIVQDNSPIYLNPVNKKRQINFDEELLVIFFSILNYLNDYYGFDAQINCNFDLITGKHFEAYINGLGRTRLLQIKYKYFSDKALELWELCYAFFDHAKQVRLNVNQQEYLLVKNFNIVFEAIIDELIGDKVLPDGMKKEQEDGKIVDHLYTERSLIENKEHYTYYIGDSKYYKIGHELGRESVYKQYTYAKNVIQWNLDIFNDKETPDPVVKLRDDDLTEGYNIIPNFFISAKIEKPFNYADDGIDKTDRSHNKYKQVHFDNRLFDRDTLLLSHYDVNFLFVLSLYARNNSLQKSAWKAKVHGIFRKEIQERLQEEFDFYAMRPLQGVNAEEYIMDHFHDVLGKVYTPYADNNIFSLALDNKNYKEENDKLLDELRLYFDVVKCQLGDDPHDILPKQPEEINVATSNVRNNLALCVVKEGDNFDIAIAEVQRTGRFGVALQESGAVLRLVEGFTRAKFLIIHNKGEKYKAFYMDGKGPNIVYGKSVKDMATTKKDAEMYLVYDVELSPQPVFGKLDFTPIIRDGDSYSPHLINISTLISYSE